jgi:tRNA uridine 5-carboxymethylaminomethyl modification enzyme
LNLRLGRLKTGTPPRILAKTINFEKMGVQESETRTEYFCYFPDSEVRPKSLRKDMACYTVYTNDETSQAVKDNLDKAPMYQGKIKGIGTRYCPSFEDKVIRFPHHDKHMLYLRTRGRIHR